MLRTYAVAEDSLGVPRRGYIGETKSVGGLLQSGCQQEQRGMLQEQQMDSGNWIQSNLHPNPTMRGQRTAVRGLLLSYNVHKLNSTLATSVLKRVAVTCLLSINNTTKYPIQRAYKGYPK
jgi:hypothetical protein